MVGDESGSGDDWGAAVVIEDSADLAALGFEQDSSRCGAEEPRASQRVEISPQIDEDLGRSSVREENASDNVPSSDIDEEDDEDDEDDEDEEDEEDDDDEEDEEEDEDEEDDEVEEEDGAHDEDEDEDEEDEESKNGMEEGFKVGQSKDSTLAGSSGATWREPTKGHWGFEYFPL